MIFNSSSISYFNNKITVTKWLQEQNNKKNWSKVQPLNILKVKDKTEIRNEW